MLKTSAILTAMLMALFVDPAAVQAQDTEAPAEGKFRLTLEGQAPENVSFWVESSIGDGGVICTTDAAMVETGITECRDGGEVNEMSYSAPAGSTFEYRIVGSQGVELSQEVVAEGSKVAENGFVVDASFTFSGEPIGDEPSGTRPEDSPSTDDADGTDGDGAAGDQYEDDSSDNDKESSDKEDSGKEDSNAEDGVLPNTGGSSLVLVAGAALLLAAGGFLAYRSIS